MCQSCDITDVLTFQEKFLQLEKDTKSEKETLTKQAKATSQEVGAV